MQAKSTWRIEPRYIAKDEIKGGPLYTTVREFVKNHLRLNNQKIIDELGIMVRVKCTYLGFPIGLPQNDQSECKKYTYPDFLLNVCYGDWKAGIFNNYKRVYEKSVKGIK